MHGGLLVLIILEHFGELEHEQCIDIVLLTSAGLGGQMVDLRSSVRGCSCTLTGADVVVSIAIII